MKTSSDKPTVSFDPFNLAFWRSHLSLIILIPYLLGGIWQLLELFSISPVYVRFFSLSQTIPDGLMMLFLLCLLLLAVQVWRKRSVTEMWVRKWLPVETTINVKLFVFLITGFITWLVIYVLLLGSGILDGYTILVSLILLVLWAAIYASKDSYKHTQAKSVTQKVKKSSFQTLRFVLIVSFVGCCVGLVPQFIGNVSEGLTDLDSGVSKIQYKNSIARHLSLPNGKKIKVVYFNDQYLFVKSNGRRFVVPFEVLFGRREESVSPL